MKPISHSVDIAMMKIAQAPEQLYSLGLGSCVGVAVYDPIAKIGGLIHVLLPSIKEFTQGEHKRTKFADSGIEDLINAVSMAGAAKYRLKAKIAGGAAMFASESSPMTNTIGGRNVQSSIETLKRLGIDLVAQNTGGNKGRSIYFDVSTGALTIKTIDREIKI